jgi:HD superfamily phosphohydrolase
MKKEIIAYITALIDVYSHTVNMPMKDALDNLMEFVVDIPEYKEDKEQSIKFFNITLENEDLKQSNAQLLNRISELNQLEENHEYLKDINEKLYKKVENLEIALTISKSVMDPLLKEKLRETFKKIK